MSPPVEVSEYRGLENMSPVLECHQLYEVTASDFKCIYEDDSIKEAAEKAEREGCVRPLILHELKTKIQLTRVQQGKKELVLEPELPKVYELTEEERVKQDKRKNRNRHAAKVSRLKKKDQHAQLQKENKALTRRMDHLKNDVKRLTELADTLQKSVKSSRICHKAYHSQLQGKLLKSLSAVENIAQNVPRQRRVMRYSIPFPLVQSHLGQIRQFFVTGQQQQQQQQDGCESVEELRPEVMMTDSALGPETRAMYGLDDLMDSNPEQLYETMDSQTIALQNSPDFLDRGMVVFGDSVSPPLSVISAQLQAVGETGDGNGVFFKHGFYRSALSSPSSESGSPVVLDGSPQPGGLQFLVQESRNI